jgi:hypothetical protein
MVRERELFYTLQFCCVARLLPGRPQQATIKGTATKPQRHSGVASEQSLRHGCCAGSANVDFCVPMDSSCNVHSIWATGFAMVDVSIKEENTDVQSKFLSVTGSGQVHFQVFSLGLYC